MDPIEKRELKRKAWMRLAAQRRRAGLLRGRVLALSLICFAALWAIVFVQMATGNDPVLTSKERTVAARVASPSTRQEVETTEAHAEEAAPVEKAEAEEVEPELEEPEVEVEEPGVDSVEPEPEPVEEPLVTSQS